MKIYYFLFSLFFTTVLFSQESLPAYKNGEYLKYRIHYGIINAGYASLEAKEFKKDTISQFQFIGKGWTTGMLRWVFKVEDHYESFIDKNSQFPLHFKRRVNEGGYTIKRDIYFDHVKKKARVEDHKKSETKEFSISEVQDMISSFYYLRNHNVKDLKKGDILKLDMFFDFETFPFKLQYLGKEVIKTKFGKISCYKMRPVVKSGRVFEAEESLTLWITADKNKIPVRIKASLAVGSLKADLYKYKGLSHPFPIIL